MNHQKVSETPQWVPVRSGKAKDVWDRIYGRDGHYDKLAKETERAKSLFYSSWYEQNTLRHDEDIEIIQFKWALAFSTADVNELRRCFAWSDRVMQTLSAASWESSKYTHWQQRAPTMMGFCLELLYDCLISEGDSAKWSSSFGYEPMMKYNPNKNKNKRRKRN